MCGISGIYSLNAKPVRRDVLKNMNDLLIHRGPDGEGYLAADSQEASTYFYPSAEAFLNKDSSCKKADLCFAHRRLRIIDLSDNARQPMPNEDNSMWVILNGEIFNYIELREELIRLGHQFRSNSDTEVILHAYESFGFDCVKRFNGMWAFALWDARKKILFCSRDRFGIKPFYYFYNKEIFAFASEIKALLHIRRAETNERAVFNYLVKSFGFIDVTEETLFKDIFQLIPAHNLIIDAQGLRIFRYWNVNEGNGNIHNLSQEDAIQRFRSLFIDSVKLRMRSDVKVAGALSGGMDSSSITCVIKRCLKIDNYETYSACFDNRQFDEREYISAVTRETGFKSNYVFPDSESLFDIIKRQIWLQDEPFNAMWVHSQWFIYQKARADAVKVFLNGHGGDETLGGYYPHFEALWAELLRRGRFGSFFKEISQFRFRNPNRRVNMPNVFKQIINYYTPQGIKDSYSTFPNFLSRSFIEQNRKSEYHYDNPTKDILNRYLFQSLFIAPIRGMLHFDDRNSMSFSIEARVPFLDFRLIEFLFSIPGYYKIKDGYNKYILREAMKDILPKEIQLRYGKKGFASAAPEWFRERKDVIYDLLESNDSRTKSYFDHRKLRKIIEDHFKFKADRHEQIASWLTLELWFRQFIDNNAGFEVYSLN